MINYKGTPLFGEDSNLRNTSEFFAIAGTAVFWLVFLILSFVIKTEPKKKYNEVQIVLSSTPVVQKSEASPLPSEQAAAASNQTVPEEKSSEELQTAKKSAAAANSVEQKPAQKAVEIQKPSTQQKKQTQTAPASVPKTQSVEPIQYAVDPMEAFANQTKKQNNKDFDWSVFDEDESPDFQETKQIKVQENTQKYSGQAGTVASETSGKITSQNTKNEKSQVAAGQTSKTLEGIKNSTFVRNAPNGIESKTEAQTKISGSGKVEMKMSNGRSRALINPARPVINLSAQAASTVDTSKNVVITCRVLESGNVSEISITPEDVLSSLVRKEIIEQLSKWQFEPADYSAIATFPYTIRMR